MWGIVGKFISLQRNGEQSHAFAYGNGGMSSKIHLRCVLKILFYDFLQKYEISFRLLFV